MAFKSIAIRHGTVKKNELRKSLNAHVVQYLNKRRVSNWRSCYFLSVRKLDLSNFFFISRSTTPTSPKAPERSLAPPSALAATALISLAFTPAKGNYPSASRTFCTFLIYPKPPPPTPIPQLWMDQCCVTNCRKTQITSVPIVPLTTSTSKSRNG